MDVDARLFEVDSAGLTTTEDLKETRRDNAYSVTLINCFHPYLLCFM